MMANTDRAFCKASETENAATHVELTFQDTLNRADLWNMAVSELRRRKCIYQDQILTFLGSIKIFVRKIYVHGQRVPSAAFADTTKPVFRSESARFTIAMQMSKEMWNFDDSQSGDMLLTKGIQFLTQLFARWEKLKCSHVVTLILFTRLTYEDERDAESHGLLFANLRSCTETYRDFYRVVVSETPNTDSRRILQKLKKECNTFLRDAEMQPLPSGPVIAGRPTSARRGNFLEAVSLATAAYLKDDIDSDFLRTGTSIVVITPGTAIFDADENLLRLTTQNLLNRAFGMDLVCLSRVPLHFTPLFAIPRKSVQASESSFNAPNDPKVSSPLQECSRRPQVTWRSSIFKESPQLHDVHDGKGIPEKHYTEFDYVLPSWIEVSFYHGDTGAVAELNDERQSGMSEVFSPQYAKPETRIQELKIPPLTSFLHSDQSEFQNRITIPSSVQVELRSTSEPKRPSSSEAKTADIVAWMDQYDKAAFQISKNTATVSQRSSLEHLSSSGVRKGFLPTPKVDPRPFSPKDTLNSPAQSREGSASVLSQDQQRPQQANSTRIRPNEASASLTPSPKKTSARSNITSLLHGSVYGKAAPAKISAPEATRSSPSFSARSNDQSLPQQPSHNQGATYADQIRASLSKAAPSTIPRPSTDASDKPLGNPSSKVMDNLEIEPQASDVKPAKGLDEVNVGAFRAASMSKRNFKTRNVINESNDLPTIAGGVKSEGSLPWLVIRNPSKPEDSKIGSFGHWNHAFVRHVEPTVVKWRALSAPASLPLTTENFPTIEQLRNEFTEHPYTISMSEVEQHAIPSARAHLAREMVQCRLSEGFQIAVGKRTSEITSRPGARFMDLFEEDFMTEDGATQFLLRGDDAQLICATGDEISVTRYARRCSTPHPVKYNVKMKTLLEMEYRETTFPLSVFPDTNWNAVDHYIASHEYGVTELPTQNVFAGLHPRRVRFVLIPVEPPQSTMAAEDSEEEIRTEGIRKLTIMWQKFRYTSPEEARFRTAWDGHRDPNPLAIEYQTRDPAALVTAGLESTLLEEGEATAAQTSLFNESEAYRTSHVDLSRLAADLQGDNGIKLRDRRWHFRLYHYCFVGVDMVSFLLANFQDLKSREEAVEFGNVLMAKGLFEHVHSKHHFRDGNFYYTLSREYRLPRNPDTKPPSNWFGPRSVPATPASEPPKEFSFEGAISSKRPKVRLSGTLQHNVDPRKLSDRLEIITIHYDRLHNPANAFHFHIEWTNATTRLIEDSLISWAMQMERHGLKLIQLPLNEACTVNATNPFRMPYVLELAVKPPSPSASTPLSAATIPHSPRQTPKDHHRQSGGSPGLAPHVAGPDESHYLKELLRKRLDFVLDFEAAAAFPPDVDVSYSWGSPDYTYTQFIHRSGLILAQTLPGARLLLLANRLWYSRTSVVGRGETKLAQHAESSTTGRTASGVRRSGKVPPATTAESIKDDVEAFCTDAKALRQVWEEVEKEWSLAGPPVGASASASVRGTPALSATRSLVPTPALSARLSEGGGFGGGGGGGDMTASIPSLELGAEEAGEAEGRGTGVGGVDIPEVGRARGGRRSNES